MADGQARIGIIGAGLGGVALCVLLRRAGFDAQIYEQAQRFSRVGAGIQMGANATKALRGLGVLDRLREVGFRPESLLNRDHDSGAVSNELPGGEALEQRYGSPHMCLHRADLHRALEELLPPGVVHLDRKLARYEDDGGEVVLHFTDGATATVDALIGADGVHSTVRSQMIGPDLPRYTGRVAYRTTFPATLLRKPLNLSRTKWWGPDRHIVIYYVTKAMDEVYFVTSQPDDARWMTRESWSAMGDVDDLRQAYAGFHQEVRDVIDVCPTVFKWALMTRDPLPRWTAGRVALLGDACHPMAPYMAQGAAAAFEDAVILARCLDGVTPGSFPAAFARYEANRKPRATDVQTLSNENTFLRRPGGTDWVYGYDAWTAPLDEPGTTRATAA